MMKIALLITLCLLAGSQASFMDSLKNALGGVGKAFTDTFHQVGQQAKVVGQNLLDNVKQQGTQLANQALQSLLLGTVNALTQQPATKRSLTDLLNKAGPLKQQLEHLIHEKVDNLQGVLGEAVKHLQQLSTQITTLPVGELHSKVDQVVAAHHAVADKLTHDLVQGLTHIFGEALSLHPSVKRTAFGDALKQLGDGLTAFFQPHVEHVKQLVGGLGETLKQTTSTLTQNLANNEHTEAVKQSANQLAYHGKNALNALKDAVTDILGQTLTNVQPHLANLLNHGAQALSGAVAQTLAGTDAPETA